MSLQANDLKKSKRHLEHIERETSQVLISIDAEIFSANEEGNTSITYWLPLHFGIPNISNSNAQAKIYYACVMSLKKRGFDTCVVFHKANGKFGLEIHWCLPGEAKEIETQKIALGKMTKVI